MNLISAIMFFLGSFITCIVYFKLHASNERKRNVKQIDKIQNEYLAKLLKLEEQEQERISRDIHDELGPSLTGISLLIDSFDDVNLPVETKSKLIQIKQLIKSSIKNIQFISRNLSGFQVNKNGLTNTIQGFIDLIEQNTKIKIFFKHELHEGSIKPNVLAELYNVIHELVSNSVRHSDCSEIRIAIKTYDHILYVLYAENGKKWSANKAKAHTGMGLKNIQKRISQMNGNLFLDPANTSELLIYLTIPKMSYVKTDEDTISTKFDDFYSSGR